MRRRNGERWRRNARLCRELRRRRALLVARSLRVSGTEKPVRIWAQACERRVRARRTAGSVRVCGRRQSVHAGNVRGRRLRASAGLRRQRLPQRPVSRRPMLHGMLGRHELSRRNGDRFMWQRWLRLPHLQRHRRAVHEGYMPGFLPIRAHQWRGLPALWREQRAVLRRSNLRLDVGLRDGELRRRLRQVDVRASTLAGRPIGDLELTGTGDGRLFGFAAPQQTGSTRLVSCR